MSRTHKVLPPALQRTARPAAAHRKQHDASDDLVRENRSAVIEKLRKIPGIDLKSANRLYRNHGIRDVKDLKHSAGAGLLNAKQKEGLEYLSDIMKKIPAEEVGEHKRYIDARMKLVSAQAKFWIMGSYRRKLARVGDINVVITGTESIVPLLVNFMTIKHADHKPYIVHIFEQSKTHVTAMCQLPGRRTKRRIDIQYASEDELPFMLMYLTGPVSFNISMRNIAQAKGFILTDKGLFVDVKNRRRRLDLKITSESQIFELLGIKYLKPSDRNSNNIVYV